MKTLRIGCMAVILSIPAVKSGAASLPSQVQGHGSRMMANVVARDGTSRTIKLEGVGCTESMCSRVFIRSKSAGGAPLQVWLDTLASVKDTSEHDALFVMRDGTERRLSFVSDFRVLYVSDPNGRIEKLDFAKIRSLEILNKGN